MTQYKTTKPELQLQAEWIADYPGEFAEVVEAGAGANKSKAETEKLRKVPITVDNAVEKLRELRDQYRKEFYQPWLARLLHTIVMRKSVDIMRSVSDRSAYLILAMVDDSQIESAGRDLIPPDGATDQKKTTAKKLKYEKERQKALDFIRETVPPDVLGNFESGDFFRSSLWEGFRFWRDLLRSMKTACDPLGMKMTEANRYRLAFEVLNLSKDVGGEAARYEPAEFDERFN